MTTTDRRGRGLTGTGKIALWLVAAHALVLALCFAGAHALPDHVSADQCEGLGWGCTPTPRDGSILILVFFGVPALTISLLLSLIALGVVAAVRGQRRRKAAGPHREPGSQAQRAVPGGSDGRARDEPEQ